MPITLSRRAMLAGTAASVAAAVSPAFGAAGLALPISGADRIDQLARELSAALTAEYGGDFECTIGPDGAIAYRWGLPILDLFSRWRAAADASSAAPTAAEADRSVDGYFRLRDEIIATAPGSAREAAIQFIVDTDNGDSDFSEGFLARTRSMAFGV